MGRGRRTLCMLGAVTLAQVVLAVLAAGCVDGVTPNCSDPAVRCEPSADGSVDRAEVAPDAPSLDTSRPDTSADAPAEADLDAGDEI